MSSDLNVLAVTINVNSLMYLAGRIDPYYFLEDRITIRVISRGVFQRFNTWEKCRCEYYCCLMNVQLWRSKYCNNDWTKSESGGPIIRSGVVRSCREQVISSIPGTCNTLPRYSIDVGQSKMPSKGINVYSYTSLEDIAIEFTVPKVSVVNTSADNFTRKDLEVESKNIPGETNFTGQFKWSVLQNGVELASAYNNINSLSGRLEGGTMTKTEACLSIVKDDLIITYGFYDAGVGLAGLPSKDQCWVSSLHQSPTQQLSS